MKKHTVIGVALFIVAILALTGCNNMAHEFHNKGGGGGASNRGGPSITVSPGNLRLVHGNTVNFSATVSGLDNPAVTWELSGNAIDSDINGSGLLSVHLGEPGATVLTVTARSVTKPSLVGRATVTVAPLFSIGGGQTGTLTITYTNGTAISGTLGPGGGVAFSSGQLLPGGDRVIKTIQLDSKPVQLIGRRDDSDTIRVKLNSSGVIIFRDGSPAVPIGTYAELQLINTSGTTLAGNYIQEADIDLMGSSVPLSGVPANWVTIGNSSSNFTGQYNGGGYLIDRLYISTGTGFQGLFGLSTGELRDIHIGPGSSVTGGGPSGGVVGAVGPGGTVTGCTNKGEVTGGVGSGGVAGVNSGTMNNCSNSGTVTLNTAGSGGGVVGSNIGTMNNCSNSGTVTSNNSVSIGGVAGLNRKSVNNCSNSGNITGTGASAVIGGVIGENAGDSADAVITACFNKGQVSGDLYVYVGGVAGSNYSMSGQNAFITASYNMGTVIGNGSTGIGGVVGKNEIATNSAAVTACYNSGAVTGTGTNIGGVVGEIVNGATNTACYWYAGVANNVAVNGVGSAGNNAEATPFGSAGDWPVINTNLAWGTGSGGPAGYWKSLGSWNNGSPVFPKLYWE